MLFWFPRISFILIDFVHIYLYFYIFLISDDIFDEAGEQVKPISGLQLKCLGGGRIEHDPDNKTIKVFGYSQVNFRD